VGKGEPDDNPKLEREKGGWRWHKGERHSTHEGEREDCTERARETCRAYESTRSKPWRLPWD